ncbi:hypothetical protein C8Q73DRAFT_706529 [Cubamyces lactineus]|nr:hypothetical protein C8Q73DRAFT_706529 [Cubamyces lactineus]
MPRWQYSLRVYSVDMSTNPTDTNTPMGPLPTKHHDDEGKRPSSDEVMHSSDGEAQYEDKSSDKESHSSEEVKLMRKGPSRDPALQGFAKFPPPPDDRWENEEQHYALGWQLTPERIERLWDLFIIGVVPDVLCANHEILGPGVPAATYMLRNEGVTFRHIWYNMVLPLDAQPLQDGEELITRPEHIYVATIDATMSPLQHVRPTQAEYDWMVQAMGAEPQWFLWPWGNAKKSRHWFYPLRDCEGCEKGKHCRYTGGREQARARSASVSKMDATALAE